MDTLQGIVAKTMYIGLFLGFGDKTLVAVFLGFPLKSYFLIVKGLCVFYNKLAVSQGVVSRYSLNFSISL